MKPRIIPADDGRREAWLRMRVALWPECPRRDSSDEITRILQSNRETAFLALDTAGDVIGFAEVSTREYVDGCSTGPVGYVEGIYVLPERRGRGIGRELVRAAERWARARGCDEMGSDARLTDAPSIAFHQAIGFAETDRQVVFLKKIGR